MSFFPLSLSYLFFPHLSIMPIFSPFSYPPLPSLSLFPPPSLSSLFPLSLHPSLCSPLARPSRQDTTVSRVPQIHLQSPSLLEMCAQQDTTVPWVASPPNPALLGATSRRGGPPPCLTASPAPLECTVPALAPLNQQVWN